MFKELGDFVSMEPADKKTRLGYCGPSSDDDLVMHNDELGTAAAVFLLIDSEERKAEVRKFVVTRGFDCHSCNELTAAVSKPGKHLVMFWAAVNARRKHGNSRGKGLRFSWQQRMRMKKKVKFNMKNPKIAKKRLKTVFGKRVKFFAAK
jgi:hypothetical protein